MAIYKKGSSGDVVKKIKDRLVELRYLSKSTHSTFGDDTCTAVKKFQKDNGLTSDGIVGEQTMSALFPVEKKEEPEVIDSSIMNISSEKLKLILNDLSTVSAKRKKIVKQALKNAYDYSKPDKYPYSLYIRGGNLYNKDLTPNIITAKTIEAGSIKYPQYYEGGSKEMMLKAVAYNPKTTGADCSGGIVGLMRYAGVVSPSFDASADSLCGNSHSRAIAKNELIPGDWVGRSGHIGLYVGGGYVVEWYGQNYGCQLTGLGTKRKAYDFVNKKYGTRSDWTKYRRPKYYS